MDPSFSRSNGVIAGSAADAAIGIANTSPVARIVEMRTWPPSLATVRGATRQVLTKASGKPDEHMMFF
jgi:hypothetical protein